MKPVQHLVTLPPAMARVFSELESRQPPDWFATSDPPGRKLGSGGATAHLLVEAWRATGAGQSWDEWLAGPRKLCIHGGGQSRRLPAYAAVGKVLMPIPALRWASGHRLDQTLLDLQLPGYRRVARQAAGSGVALVASGDVLLRFGDELPVFPDVDVLGLGMWVTPDVAKDFGVFFVSRQRPQELAFFLQKPSTQTMLEHSTDYFYLVDTGMWLLSERAIRVLLAKSGWEENGNDWVRREDRCYELYGEFGLALGCCPVVRDAEVAGLRSAVVPLPEAHFHHFGTSRQLITSVSALQNLVLDERKLGLIGAKRHPDQYLQNSRFSFPLRQEENHTLWVENSSVPKTWQLAHDHVLTGIPENPWELPLEPGVGLDVIPVGAEDYCVRAYGIDDPFRGLLGEETTQWLGRPVRAWFEARGLELGTAGLEAERDIQTASLFPVVRWGELEPGFVEWLFAARPIQEASYVRRWRELPRLSAEAIRLEANVRRLYTQRAANRRCCLEPLARHHRVSVLYKLDLESTARMFAESESSLPSEQCAGQEDLEPMQQVHAAMFRSAILRWRGQSGWETAERGAFARLRQMMIEDSNLARVGPRRSVLEDQIVWGRSPVRLDLAGGWTDTPPYCLEHGGKVVNLAVDLNGQPPIQVFARLSDQPELVMRSIDLGIELKVRTFEELEGYGEPGAPFALAKAGFALAGFLPQFHAGGAHPSLRAQLEDFGGGIEVSLLSAVPKGSGLGTSSILASTLLATLGDLCGLNWDRIELFRRTLVLEQMLTTGGGWQDQAGGIFRGLKCIETPPGLVQRPTLRWLPEHLFDQGNEHPTILLYYTGLTRLAKSILHEIVRGIFLNSPDHLSVVQEIGVNAEAAYQALQCSNYEGLVETVRTSWELNQRLDRGTNPESVAAVLAAVRDELAAAKLLGAGGGGYLLLFAKDESAARRIRERLDRNPPNRLARFVRFRLSSTGLQVTRS